MSREKDIEKINPIRGKETLVPVIKIRYISKSEKHD